MKKHFQMDIVTILVSKAGEPPPVQFTNYKYFLAILELSDPVYFSKNIRPICLPVGSITTHYHSQIGTISGWGKTENSWATNLKKVDVLIFKTDICKKIMHIQGEHTWDGSMGYNTISE